MNEIIAFSFLGAIIIFLIRRVIVLSRVDKTIPTNLIYTDRSGIEHNPPQHFIDVWENKTINFKFKNRRI